MRHLPFLNLMAKDSLPVLFTNFHIEVNEFMIKLTFVKPNRQFVRYFRNDQKRSPATLLL